MLRQRRAHAAAWSASSERFGVNVLAAGQEDLARLFASKTPEAEKFAGVQHTVHDGIPVIEGTLAWVGCTLERADPGRRSHDRHRRRHRRRAADRGASR